MTIPILLLEPGSKLWASHGRGQLCGLQCFNMQTMPGLLGREPLFCQQLNSLAMICSYRSRGEDQELCRTAHFIHSLYSVSPRQQCISSYRWSQSTNIHNQAQLNRAQHFDNIIKCSWDFPAMTCHVSHGIYLTLSFLVPAEPISTSCKCQQFSEGFCWHGTRVMWLYIYLKLIMWLYCCDDSLVWLATCTNSYHLSAPLCDLCITGVVLPWVSSNPKEKGVKKGQLFV